MSETRRLKLVGGGMCPEQYEVYLDGVEVGYMRLRHGHFTVQRDGPVIYSANPDGDGAFEDYERVKYLNAGCRAILDDLDGKLKTQTEEPIYDVEEPKA